MSVEMGANQRQAMEDLQAHFAACVTSVQDKIKDLSELDPKSLGGASEESFKEVADSIEKFIRDTQTSQRQLQQLARDLDGEKVVLRITASKIINADLIRKADMLEFDQQLFGVKQVLESRDNFFCFIVEEPSHSLKERLSYAAACLGSLRGELSESLKFFKAQSRFIANDKMCELHGEVRVGRRIEEPLEFKHAVEKAKK